MTSGPAVTLFCLYLCLPATPSRADNAIRDNAPPQSISLQDYPGRLIRWHSVVDACMRSMTPASCNWELVGPDAAVRTSGGVRIVQLAWLRGVLANAAAANLEPAALKDASAGLRDAALQLDQQLSRQQQVHQASRNVVSERATLKNILTTGGYAQEIPPTLFERLRDAFRRWLEARLNAVGGSPGSQLFVDLLLITLMVVICGGMIVWLARKVHSQSLLLLPASRPHPSAPSAQDWETWLEQGRSFAGKQQWREAIHNVYWSAISRLESRGLWPADRARTPREYLTLLAGRPEAAADLHALTRSFERTWYGDLAAGQPEFDSACALLEKLAR